MRRRWWFAAFLVLAVGAALANPRQPSPAGELPARLSDQEFWKLVSDASEPGGYFRSANITNLTSNELWFQSVIPDLVERTKPGGVYLGVGPEQNYTYMAALKPRLAIIFDIRRGNLDLQLMYKALFELAADRADFVSMLFSKPRPDGLTANATAAEIFAAVGRSETSEALFDTTLEAILNRLTRVHGFPLPAADLDGIEQIFRTFYRSGFWVRSSPSYEALMTSTDQAGVNRSYLADEESFKVLKDLQTRNLVIPVVGDFGGAKAIRFVGRFLKTYGLTVSAFYLSNVEQYLFQAGTWGTFCRNVAGLPLDTSSTFIRSSNGGGGFGGGFVSSLGRMTEEVSSCQALASTR
jgi:hypothetical protein